MSKRSNAAMLKRARPRTEPFTVMLDVGDGALDAYNDLIETLRRIPDPPKEGADKHKAARDKAAKAVLAANEKLHAEQEFEGRVKVLPLLTWESLKSEHPPREGNDSDLLAGVDRSHAADIVRPAVLFEAEGGGWLSPTDDEWADFEAAVGAPEMYRLLDQVTNLNERAVSVPKLPSDFLATQGRRSA